LHLRIKKLHRHRSAVRISGLGWGKTDCNEPEVEPCDFVLNRDAGCDGFDWLLFYPDWGRTDCPIP